MRADNHPTPDFEAGNEPKVDSTGEFKVELAHTLRSLIRLRLIIAGRIVVSSMRREPTGKIAVVVN